MKTEEQVWTILVEANPIPMDDGSDATDLENPEQRSSVMTQVKIEETTTDEPRNRRRMTLLAASIVVVAGVAVVLLQGAGETIDPADLPISDGPQVEAVNETIEAFNTGDFEAFSETIVLPETADIVNGTWSVGGEIRYMYEVFINANARFTIVEPCQLVALEPSVVECVISHEDDFWGAAGVSGVARDRFELDDQNRVTDWDVNLAPEQDLEQLNQAFWTWLESDHPELRAQWDTVRLTLAPGQASDPAVMGEAVEYMDEFLAQSDEYPLVETPSEDQ